MFQRYPAPHNSASWPGTKPGQRLTPEEIKATLLKTDPATKAMEIATATSASLYAIFNSPLLPEATDGLAARASAAVPDLTADIGTTIEQAQELGQAYAMAMPQQAAQMSLNEKFLEMFDRGPEATEGLISNLKGKLGEFHARDLLNENGYTQVTLAQNPNQPFWDIKGFDPAGNEVLIQVKTTGPANVHQMAEAMTQNPNVGYITTEDLADQIDFSYPDLSDRVIGVIGDNVELKAQIWNSILAQPEMAEQIWDNIAAQPELADQIINTSSAFYHISDAAGENLELISESVGATVPDAISKILPHAAVIIAGFRLAYAWLQNERQFRDQDRTTKNKIQVITALTTGSRLGINTAFAAAGGAAGGAVGSIIPVAGNLIGGLAGAVGGFSVGNYLNSHLQPYMLDLALDITEMNHDDLWYLKNRESVNQLAERYHQRANNLKQLSPGLA